MAEAEKEEGSEGGEEKPKKSKKTLIIVIVAVVVVLLGVGGALMFMGGGKEGDGHEEEAAEEEKHYQTFELETFIVNLVEGNTYLKVKMLVEYDPALLAAAGGEGGGHGGGGYGGGGSGGGEEAAGGMPPEIAHREPMIRDAVISLLSSKKPAEVLTQDGKEKLKEDLIEVMNDAIGLDEGPIVGIYFLEFILQ